MLASFQNGVQSVLNYIEFFTDPAVQRNALQITASCCSNLTVEEFEFVQPVLPLLSQRISLGTDKKCVEYTCVAFSRIAECFHSDADRLREIASHGLLPNIQQVKYSVNFQWGICSVFLSDSCWWDIPPPSRVRHSLWSYRCWHISVYLVQTWQRICWIAVSYEIIHSFFGCTILEWHVRIETAVVTQFPACGYISISMFTWHVVSPDITDTLFYLLTGSSTPGGRVELSKSARSPQEGYELTRLVG